MIRTLMIMAVGLLALCGQSALAADVVPAYVKAAVADLGRPPKEIARDIDRKPAEVIAFSGMRVGDKVIDFAPGQGYYTRIFSKLVGESGMVYALAPKGGPRALNQVGVNTAVPSNAPPPPKEPQNALLLPILAIKHIGEYSQNVMPIQETVSDFGGAVSVPAQVDIVWTSNNYHDFHNNNFAPNGMLDINKAIFRALKPGGVYMVIDYAAAKGKGFTQTETLHRSDSEAVKAEVLAAGFAFDGESKVLANRKDDHTKPSNVLGDKTDQYVLKFRKPLAATGDNRPGPDAIKDWYDNTFVLGTPDKRFRTIFYHADHSYQEFGMNDMQSATWYWDADGNNCMYHEFPADSLGVTICHPFEESHKAAKIGETFLETMGNGQKVTVSLAPGHLYPNTTTWVKPGE